MRADDFLKSALDALEQRAVLRDQPGGERSAARAAAIVSAWEGREYDEAHIWRVQIAIKQAREIQGQFHADDYTDLSGYAGLLGECQAAPRCASHEVDRQVIGLAEHSAEIKRLREALEMARGMVADWGEYASAYFKDKYDLPGELAVLDRVLAETGELK